MKKDLTEFTKEITVDEAIAIANNAEASFQTDPDKTLAALLKLQSLYSLIAAPLKTLTDQITKTCKKNGEEIEVSTRLKMRNPNNPSGLPISKDLSVMIKSVNVSKTEIDFDAFKAANGIEIVTNPNDAILNTIKAIYPGIHGYIQGSKGLELLKAPTLAGNPTAFEAAVTREPELAKFKTTKTISRYEVDVNVNIVEEA